MPLKSIKTFATPRANRTHKTSRPNYTHTRVRSRFITTAITQSRRTRALCHRKKRTDLPRSKFYNPTRLISPRTCVCLYMHCPPTHRHVRVLVPRFLVYSIECIINGEPRAQCARTYELSLLLPSSLFSPRARSARRYYQALCRR